MSDGESKELSIPKWFLGLLATMVPVIAALTAWGVLTLQSIKVEVAVLSTKADMTRELQVQVIKLTERLRELERLFDRSDSPGKKD